MKEPYLKKIKSLGYIGTYVYKSPKNFDFLYQLTITITYWDMYTKLN